MLRSQFSIVFSVVAALMFTHTAFADIESEINEEMIDGTEQKVLVIQSEELNDLIFCNLNRQSGMLEITAVEFIGEVPEELYFSSFKEDDFDGDDIGDFDAESISIEDFDVIRIETGSGNDAVIAYPGDVRITIVAGSGDDFVYADIVNDVQVYGGWGRDRIEIASYSPGSSCSVYGGPDSDWLDGYQVSYCILEGDGGNDVIRSFCQLAQLSGGQGNDLIHNWSTQHPALLYGDDGNDVLVGGKALDTLDGGDDNDDLIGFGAIDEEVLESAWTRSFFQPIGLVSDIDVMVDGQADVMLGGSGADCFYADFTKTKARRAFKTYRQTQVINGRMVWVTVKKRAHEFYTSVIETESVRDFSEDDGDQKITTNTDPIRF